MLSAIRKPALLLASLAAVLSLSLTSCGYGDCEGAFVRLAKDDPDPSDCTDLDPNDGRPAEWRDALGVVGYSMWCTGASPVFRLVNQDNPPFPQPPLPAGRECAIRYPGTRT